VLSPEDLPRGVPNEIRAITLQFA